ncbi:MAG: isoprenylcysteine carboxylmethyltransferase family protein [Terriglobia bacterium]
MTVIFAALDVGRLHQSDSVPPSWHFPAILVFSAALILQAAAMIVNPFFSPALRIQTERGHSVVTRGPYRIVRHPGYFAMIVAAPASALAVGSWLALIPAFAFSAVTIRRTALEDRYLRLALPGYTDYANSVHYRIRTPDPLHRRQALSYLTYLGRGSAVWALGMGRNAVEQFCSGWE